MTNTLAETITRDLRKTVLHDKYLKAKNEVLALAGLNDEHSGLIIPLLGPTRCGKTELLQDLKSTLETRQQSSRLA